MMTYAERLRQKRVGKSVIEVGERGLKGLTDTFYRCGKGSGFVIYSYFKDSAFTAVKGPA